MRWSLGVFKKQKCLYTTSIQVTVHSKDDGQLLKMTFHTKSIWISVLVEDNIRWRQNFKRGGKWGKVGKQKFGMRKTFLRILLKTVHLCA